MVIKFFFIKLFINTLSNFFSVITFRKVDNLVYLTIVPIGKKTIKKMKPKIIGFVNLCRNLPKNSQIFLGILNIVGKNNDIANDITIIIDNLKKSDHIIDIDIVK